MSPFHLAFCSDSLRLTQPLFRSPDDKDYTVHRLLLATHTSGEDNNYLQIATVHLPKPQSELSIDKYDDERGGAGRNRTGPTPPRSDTDFAVPSAPACARTEIGAHTATEPRVQITQSINHTGEVNRARYMPQNPDLIATKTVMGEVYVFDRTKHPSQPLGDECKPNITLRGHTKEGCVSGSFTGRGTEVLTLHSASCRYGLSWNPLKGKEGHLLSASEDTTVCHWYARAAITALQPPAS